MEAGKSRQGLEAGTVQNREKHPLPRVLYFLLFSTVYDPAHETLPLTFGTRLPSWPVVKTISTPMLSVNLI